MKRIILSLGIMVLALAFVAPIAAAAPTQGSAGALGPADEAALVKSGAYTEVVSVDGAKVSGLSVRVSPGEHTLVMKPSYPTDNTTYTGGYFFYSNVDGTVAFKAEPGHAYVAYANTYTAPSRDDQYAVGSSSAEDQSGSGFTWVGYIEDKTTHQRVAKTERLALEAYPRSYSYGGGGAAQMHR